MELVNLQELQRLITLLRDNGVSEYKDGDLELKLGAAPVQPAGKEEQTTDERLTELDKALGHVDPAYRAAFTFVGGNS